LPGDQTTPLIGPERQDCCSRVDSLGVPPAQDNLGAQSRFRIGIGENVVPVDRLLQEHFDGLQSFVVRGLIGSLIRA
jgi:hypothetical protein